MEDKPLWKRIVSSCNNHNMNCPVALQDKTKLGGPWSIICNIGKSDNLVESLVQNSL